MSFLFRDRFAGRLSIYAATLVSVLVLVCVPALTRAGQKLEPVSHGLSFSRNIDCPPKKVSVAPVIACVSPTPLTILESPRISRLVPPVDPIPSPRPDIAARPLRAPPALILT